MFVQLWTTSPICWAGFASFLKGSTTQKALGRSIGLAVLKIGYERAVYRDASKLSRTGTSESF